MPNLPVDVLWIARYDYGRGWSLRLHQHNYLQMILFLGGEGVFTIEDESFPIRGGELFLIRSGENHGLKADSQVRTLDVKFRVLPGALSRSLQRADRHLHWDDPGLAARLERIRAEGDHKPPFYREMCSLLLTEILYLYLRRDPATQAFDAILPAAGIAPNDHILQRAIACIRGQYQHQLTIREIARAAGCTERTLRLHFHDGMRVKPLQFLQHHRIAQAKLLIQYSDYTLKEIAEKVGFQTIHHFTRMFTNFEGRSPALWRREYLEGIRKDVYINPSFENRILTEDAAPKRQDPRTAAPPVAQTSPRTRRPLRQKAAVQ